MVRNALVVVVLLVAGLGTLSSASADDPRYSRVWFFGECEYQGPTVVAASVMDDGCRGFGLFFGAWDAHSLNAEVADEAADEFGGSWGVTSLLARNPLSPFSPPIGALDTCFTNGTEPGPMPAPGLWLAWFTVEPCVAEEVVINFDEFAASNFAETLLSDEYAGLGVTFITDDAIIWDGLTDGDPGNWDLDGPDGPQFLGFNGDSYHAEIQFAANASIVAFLGARSNGSSPGTGVAMTAYCGVDEVDLDTVAFDSINVWDTVVVEAPCIDRVVIQGYGDGPFGIDSLNITYTETLPPAP